MDDVKFRLIEKKDLEKVHEIYNYYILNSTATFHITPISISTMSGIVNLGDKFYKTFIIEENGPVCGYVLLTRYSEREAFDRTAEVTIYLRHDCVSKGIGGKALSFIEKVAAESGLHALLAVICGENIPSIRLFEKNGYVKCGNIKDAGYKFGRYLDLVTYEKILK